MDWEAVRTCPDPTLLVDAIRCRGMYFLLAGHITKFLNKVNREGGKRPVVSTPPTLVVDESPPQPRPHPPNDDSPPRPEPCPQTEAASQPIPGPQSQPDAPSTSTAQGSLDAMMDIQGGAPATPPDVDADPALLHPSKIMSLEWLRSSDLTDEQCWTYLMGIEGLGRKSTACIMLLTLGRKEFPVDVHVARVCARIGWLPIIQGDPDPKDIEQYPEDPEVHK